MFAVQDEVARTIVSILAAHVNKAEAERTLLKPPAMWQAYDHYTLAAGTVDDVPCHPWERRMDLYERRSVRSEQALSIDPKYARASRSALARIQLGRSMVNPLDSEYLDTGCL